LKYSILLLAITLPGLAQVAEKANEGYKTKEDRERVARGLSAPDRDHRQKPKELVEAMGLTAGMTVADVGTGVGYMLPHLSAAVGSSGRVLAQDIQQDFLDSARKANKDLSNVTYILGTAADPKLPENAVDVILALDAYHHFDYPEKMLASLHKALKPGGRLVVVDFYKREGAMGGPGSRRALEHVRLDEADAIKEIEANGFRILSRREQIPNSQYMAIFEKK
jgi:ubiquinone/menaquinone biosynthesis C-methylase UbiE